MHNSSYHTQPHLIIVSYKNQNSDSKSIKTRLWTRLIITSDFELNVEVNLKSVLWFCLTTLSLVPAQGTQLVLPSSSADALCRPMKTEVHLVLNEIRLSFADFPIFSLSLDKA